MNHEAPMMHSMRNKTLKTRFIFCLILTIPVLVLSQTIQTWFGFTLMVPYQNFILLALAFAIYIYGGWPFLIGLIGEAKARQPGMMTLIGTAISVAFFFSAATVFFPVGMDFFWELATLIDVMLLGHWVEARSVMGASRALEELVKVMPTVAHVEMNGEVMDMPVSELQVGNLVLVRPGEKVPSDGIVVEGISTVNEALITGESAPVQKRAPDRVVGGAVNGEGSLKLQIERTGKETYLAQVILLVQQAQQSRSRTQDLASRAAALLFYVAVALGMVTFAVWSLLGNVEFALTRTVTVLVIACPHALGLAIPLVVALSTSLTAKSGILIRDRKAFEDARGIDAVIFDKTGTLTLGKFGVTDTASLIAEGELLELTAAVEQNSEHVIAKAIVENAKVKKTSIPQSSSFQALPGRGAKAVVMGKTVYVGGPSLLSELDISVTDEKILALAQTGKTVVFTVVEGRLAGAFALADQVRAESRAAVAELKAQGIKVFMLTGDSEAVAGRVAVELGIEDYFAGVLPEQKAQKIVELKQRGYRVAMVGDGINDAPALASADVGIAIGAGTDVAIESADVILVKSNPKDVACAICFSRKTYRKMVQNLWWAAGYNIFALPLAAGVFAGLGIVVDPAVGAVLMTLSTVIVAVNSQTLRRQM
ncbi:MAG: copper-translocating P-type ATPase [Candidatus Bathyarchaeota archaeon]|nr:copper-translocating P-type ATPase [Candidatus Bathyarchaeota archaeon]